MKVFSGHRKQDRAAPVGPPVARFFHGKRQVMMVKIKPGEVYISEQNELISTNLGSCIAACVWDPERGIGGMNHFMLSLRHQETERHQQPPEAAFEQHPKYGDVAMAMLIEQLLEQGAVQSRLRVKLFGGGQVMGRFSTIGHENIVFVLQYVRQAGLHLVGSDLGEHLTRQVLFEPTSGRAWVRRFPALLYQPEDHRKPERAPVPDGDHKKEISAC